MCPGEIGVRQCPKRKESLPRFRELRKDLGRPVPISLVNRHQPARRVATEGQLLLDPPLEPVRARRTRLAQDRPEPHRHPIGLLDDLRLVALEQTHLATVGAVSDGLHDIEGYSRCPCGNWVVTVLAQQTGGKCPTCFDIVVEPLRVVEALHRGARIKVSLGQKRKPKKRSGSKGSQATHQATRHAERAALRRLRALYPEIYDMLYDQERVARGLPPKFRPDTDHAAAVKTYEVSPTYAALIEEQTDAAHSARN